MIRYGIEPWSPGPLANTNHYANGPVEITEEEIEIILASRKNRPIQ